MNKLDKIGAYELETGEEISQEILLNLSKEQNSYKIKRILQKAKMNPYSLSVEEIELLDKISSKKGNGGYGLEFYESFTERTTTNVERLYELAESMSPSAFIIGSKLLRYSSSEHTLQYKNHKNLDKDIDFCNILDINNRAWARAKKELEEHGVIRKIKFNKSIIYKINPSIFGFGMKIKDDTYFAFRDVLVKDFSLIKQIYWDKRIIGAYGVKILKDSVPSALNYYSKYFNADLERLIPISSQD